MAGTIGSLAPVAHMPLVLGVLRTLKVAQRIDELIVPTPAHVALCGRGVEALVLAILDGHHALYKVTTIALYGVYDESRYHPRAPCPITIANIMSDAVLEHAYTWLCKRRQTRAAGRRCLALASALAGGESAAAGGPGGRHLYGRSGSAGDLTKR